MVRKHQLIHNQVIPKSHHHGFIHNDGINFGFTGSTASQVQQSGNALLALRNLNGHGNGDGRADHGVVAHADQAHHLDVRRDGGRASELSVAVHTAHRVGHTVRSGTGSHVVRMQSTACTTTGSY